MKILRWIVAFLMSIFIGIQTVNAEEPSIKEQYDQAKYQCWVEHPKIGKMLSINDNETGLQWVYPDTLTLKEPDTSRITLPNGPKVPFSVYLDFVHNQGTLPSRYKDFRDYVRELPNGENNKKTIKKRVVNMRR